MRALQPRLYTHGPFHVSTNSALWTAIAVLTALAAILVLFFWAFATRAY